MRLNLLSVDPGLRETAFALFADGRLTRATLVRNPETVARGPAAWASMAFEFVRAIEGATFSTAVIEQPEQYAVAGGRRGDVSELTGVVGALSVPLAYHANELIGVLPKVWKGSIQKEAHHRRILGTAFYGGAMGERKTFIKEVPGRLSPEELRAIDTAHPKRLLHNVFDAIGIGLFQLGR